MLRSSLLRSLAAAAALLTAQTAAAQETVRFGVDAYTTGAQIWVADEKGFFADEGVAAQITTFATGVEAIDAMLVGRADMAVGLDFPVVARLQGGTLKVLAGIFHSNPGFHKLVVAEAIKTPADLAGKKIGIATGTAQHLITLRYLEESGVPADQVEIVGFTSLMEIVASLRSGRIDAAFVWADGTEKSIEGGKHYQLTDDSAANRSGSAYLAAAASFIEAKPEVAVAVLKALDSASAFIAANPDEAAAIVAKRTRAPAETMKNLLSFNTFALALTAYEQQGFAEVAEFLNRSREVPVTWENGVDPSFLQQAVPAAVDLN